MIGNRKIYRSGRRVFLDSAAAIVLVAALAGCATTPATRILPPPPLSDRIPPVLLTCPDRPAAGDLARQSDVARFVVELDAAGEDCRRKISAIKGVVDGDRAGQEK